MSGHTASDFSRCRGLGFDLPGSDSLLSVTLSFLRGDQFSPPRSRLVCPHPTPPVSLRQGAPLCAPFRYDDDQSCLCRSPSIFAVFDSLAQTQVRQCRADFSWYSISGPTISVSFDWFDTLGHCMAGRFRFSRLSMLAPLSSWFPCRPTVVPLPSVVPDRRAMVPLACLASVASS